MKIPPSLRTKLASFAFAFAFGQLKDLETIAITLQALATEAQLQVDAQ